MLVLCYPMRIWTEDHTHTSGGDFSFLATWFKLNSCLAHCVNLLQVREQEMNTGLGPPPPRQKIISESRNITTCPGCLQNVQRKKQNTQSVCFNSLSFESKILLKFSLFSSFFGQNDKRVYIERLKVEMQPLWRHSYFCCRLDFTKQKLCVISV